MKKRVRPTPAAPEVTKGKRNDPKTDWSEYNRGRSQEGKLFIHWRTQMAVASWCTRADTLLLFDL